MLGLCNRIRVIDSVLALNRERKHKVWVLWLRDADLNCRFGELFERLAGVDAVLDFSVATPPGRLWKYLLPRVLQNVAARAIHQDEMNHLLADGFAFAGLPALRSIYVRTWDRFYEGANPLGEFRLVPEFQAAVDGHGIDRQRTVGVRPANRQPMARSQPDGRVRAFDE